MYDDPDNFTACEALFLERSEADMAKLKAARKIFAEVAVAGVENEVIDLHGFDREDALYAFLEREKIILEGLRLKKVAANKKDHHYFTIILGKGKGSKTPDDKNKNWYFFEKYLNKYRYNFAFFKDHGLFMIRYNANGTKQ